MHETNYILYKCSYNNKRIKFDEGFQFESGFTARHHIDTAFGNFHPTL